MSRLACVVTTIQPPTASLRRLAEVLPASADFVVVGDRKGPREWDLARARLLTLEDQLALPFMIARQLPVGHYSRKNVGYLEAIARGAETIFETDDDNAPLESWTPRGQACPAGAAEQRDWVNAYAFFSDEQIWPRGFPLSRIRDPAPTLAGAQVVRDAPIQQALADGSPDVDATWRLVFDRSITFRRSGSAWLPPGAACPFNSQATWWWPAAFPLLYLPSTCSFRMTDIWRSFVAQRCLWELGLGLVFHAAEMFQDRNEHDSLRDFADEVSGYLLNERIVARLRETPLMPGFDAVGGNLLSCWRSLVSAGLADSAEIPLVEAWLADLATINPANA